MNATEQALSKAQRALEVERRALDAATSRVLALSAALTEALEERDEARAEAQQNDWYSDQFAAQRDEARAALAAAQEREQRVRQAVIKMRTSVRAHARGADLVTAALADD
jgi:hypothetical protein